VTVERKRVFHCGVYTRKSSEEGLEQSFNSLDAQGEACQAFITSQRHEGWRVVPTKYDDGGYSGGTMERPALQRLLDDVKKGKVNVIVVYKVDRLTRSLFDFAKIIEILDAHRASFVSVTQQFNTTTSMGRLTLNVLLSFAQFEREVTGERIRDKIAASKRKGMWMGGYPPCGYDCRNGKLQVNAAEADIVRMIYRLYLKLGCVSELKKSLDQRRVRSKVRTSKTGRRFGGFPYSRGALYQILNNRVYLGEITHHDQNYAGEHKAIVPRELWDKVQTRLRSANQGRRLGTLTNSASLLTGLLQDRHGNRFTPSHTLKSGKRYRYYVRRALGKNGSTDQTPVSLPAHDIESQVLSRLELFFGSEKEVVDSLTLPGESPTRIHKLLASASKLFSKWSSVAPSDQWNLVRNTVKRIVVYEDKIELLLSKPELYDLLEGERPGKACHPGNQEEAESVQLDIHGMTRGYGGKTRLMILSGHGKEESPRPVTPLLKALARAHEWSTQVIAGEAWSHRALARRTGFNRRYVDRVFGCAFLAPDIVEAILNGSQPPDLTFEKLTRKLPTDWVEQRRQLGFS